MVGHLRAMSKENATSLTIGCGTGGGGEGGGMIAETTSPSTAEAVSGTACSPAPRG